MSIPALSPVSLPPGATAAIVALVGSHACGTQRSDSDRDYRGVFMAPTADYFRLQAPQETIDRRDPDVTMHELRKFARLAAAANPSVLEVLWAEPIEQNEAGAELRAHRHLFLSQRAFHTYGGYARQQLEKAIKGTGGSRGQAHYRREKFVLLIRLRLRNLSIRDIREAGR